MVQYLSLTAIDIMKKQNSSRLLTWALVAAMPLWFGNCSKKSDSVTPASSSIEGTWQISGYKIDPALLKLKSGQTTNDLLAYYADFSGTAAADVITCLTTTRITFNSGGKVTGTPGSKCTASTGVDVVPANATWKLDGSKLTLTDSSGPEVFDTVLSGNTLKMSQSDSTTDYDGDGKNDTVTITLELTKV